MIPRQVPAFEVLSTKYSIACKAGDVVEGCVADDGNGKPVLAFNSPSAYCFDTFWRTECNATPLAVLGPLNKAARDLVEALS